jgi:hypothetical protein
MALVPEIVFGKPYIPYMEGRRKSGKQAQKRENVGCRGAYINRCFALHTPTQTGVFVC